MIDLIEILNITTYSNTIGKSGILISVILCERAAWTFCKTKPKLFTVLALLALSWAMLISFYSGPTLQNDLYPSLNSFVLVYIGGILSIEAKEAKGEKETGRISYSLIISFWLLVGIIFASISLPFFHMAAYDECVDDTTLISAQLLGTVGAISLWLGCFDLFSRCRYNFILALVFAVYVLCDAYYRYLKHIESGEAYLKHIPCTNQMPMGWALIFGTLKILVTVLLAYRLSKHTMSDKKLPVRTFVFKLVFSLLPAELRPAGY